MSDLVGKSRKSVWACGLYDARAIIINTVHKQEVRRVSLFTIYNAETESFSRRQQNVSH